MPKQDGNCMKPNNHYTEKEYVSSFDGNKDYDWLKFETSGSDVVRVAIFGTAVIISEYESQ